MANSPSGDSMLDRLVRILEAFDDAQSELSISTLSRRADIPLPTTYRLVSDLTRRNLLEHTPDGRVRVGMRLWELVARSSPAADLRDAALPFLQDVQYVVHHHTQLSILRDGEVLVVERLSSAESVVNQASVAARMSAHDTSMGMSLLAFSPTRVQRAYHQAHPDLQHRFLDTATDFRRALAEIRHRGYASFDGVLDAGTTGISVPILGGDGYALAAISVVVPTEPDHRLSIVAVLRTAARGIARAVGERPPE